MSHPYYSPTQQAGIGAAYRSPYAAMARVPGRNIIGADAKAEKGIVDKTKDFLGEEGLFGVKNGYLLGGAALVGLAIYGKSQRWF